jgi:ATP/maltotriose-dependent transcriptional regulator MalT
LFEKLDHARDLPVIWLSAPAGAGKTTLVSSFIENRKIPCLWYQLDKSDEDLATFLLFHEIIHSAIPRIPAGMNIVVVSRSAPAPFVRLKANSHMELLRWDDDRLDITGY